MCTSVILLLLLLAQLGASTGPCSELQQRYRPNSTDIIDVRVYEQPVMTVVRGSGGAARAAAALLLVAIRHVRGYRASLNTTFMDLCDLEDLTKFSDNSRSEVLVAAAMTYRHEGCNDINLNMQTNFAKPAANIYELQFWAYVPHDSCRGYIQTFHWTFFRNHSKVKECGFKASQSINLNSTRYSFLVLARNENSNDNEVATELQKRFDATNLQLQIKYFKSDFLMRKKISELKKKGESFLFLDENLWFDAQYMINVQPPPCTNSSTTCTSTLNPATAFRVGNGIFVNHFAPPISKLVDNFSPVASELREIFEIETAKNNSHIEDAACSWALNHNKEFENMILYNSSEDRSVYDIIIILCKNDPLQNLVKKITKLINEEIFYKKFKNIIFKIDIKIVDCYDENSLKQIMIDININITVAGVIAWSFSEGSVSVAKVAKQDDPPLLLAGPVTPETPLGPSVLAATGCLTDLTRVLLYILNSCEWSRIAILSDDSAYSKSFVLTLMKQKKLIYRDDIVRYKNISSHLDELEKADARIFLLNVNWNMSCQILCAALKRGMTPTNGFVWIVRDWRPLKCCKTNGWDGMYHYTINFGWQGEPLNSLIDDSNNLQNELKKISNIKGTLGKFLAFSDFSILADALLLLGHGFGIFNQNYLLNGYSLRTSNTFRKISQTLENITISGVAQTLQIKNFALRSPLIFFDKWTGMEAQSVGVFRINVNKVLVERPKNDICKSLFGKQLVHDRPHCGTISTGDSFSPRCQDFTVAIVTMLLLLLVTALYRARRNRLKRLLDRELNIMASLLEIRKHTASSLDIYLVNRNAIKLLHEIGSGTFGRVHFAELQRPGKGTVVVAAKEPRKDVGPTEECEFFHEACVLAPLCHNNIIKLVGICIMNGPPTLLMEHAFYLDLKRYLTERRHLVSGESSDITDDRAFEVSDESLTRLACEAASALTYLTTRRLVHRDVRAANCLIDKKRSLKLGDFGMARELDVKAPEYATIRRALFPVLWMAPESLQLGVFSFATDIWSLGVLIMEVVTLGARPYGDWQPSRVLNYVTAGGFPPLPPDVSKQTSSLLHSCWQSKAELRPSAMWVYKYLTQNPRALAPALLKPYSHDLPIINID